MNPETKSCRNAEENNVCVLFSIGGCRHLLSAAFDSSDIQQDFKFRNFKKALAADPKRYAWLELSDADSAREAAQGRLVGSVGHDQTPQPSPF